MLDLAGGTTVYLACEAIDLKKKLSRTGCNYQAKIQT